MQEREYVYLNRPKQEGEQLVDNRYNNALSALTYGFNCLVYHPKGNQLYDCILSIHEEYINILHIIIAKKISYLLKLHEIYNITDNEYSTESKLKDFNIQHYLILYTQSLDSFTFAFKTDFEKQQLRIGLIMFVREAKLYYERLNEFDPFKAEAMMTFLHADKDGGNLLDIDEIENILGEMKIYKNKEEIMSDILEIDKYLYEREKMKRPKGMTDSVLNQLGFQYLLRYYSIKEDLAKYFSSYCPMFKLKPRNQKNLIVDIVRYNEKPIMSASQLRDFYQKVLCCSTTEQQCHLLIKSFPVYDGEGKEKLEEHDMISFNNFCSLISSKRNSAFMEEKKEPYQKMSNPLSDYYVYCDFTDYSLIKEQNSSKINFYELALKRGCRGLRLFMEPSKEGQPVVRMEGDNYANLEEILKIIASKAFEFNTYPIILKINYTTCTKPQLDTAAKLIVEIFDELLFQLPPNFQQADALPSPAQLTKKIILMSDVNLKLIKAKEKDFPQQSLAFFKLISLFATRLDFQRKGQFCWNFVPLQNDKIRKFQQVQDENLSNYSKKIMIKTGSGVQKGAEVNYCSSLYLRMGVQMVGLSFRNINEQNYIMQSLFLENGGAKCGYLLKPTWMCLKNPKTLYSKNFDSPLFVLSVKVISGQNCIINEIPMGENYFIEIYLRGNKKEEEVNKKYTSGKQNSGYYTKFGVDAEFTLYCLDLAVLVILVRAEKTKQILSGRAVPVRHLREGLRPVFLLGQHFKQSVSNYVFIHTQKKDVPKKTHHYLESKT